MRKHPAANRIQARPLADLVGQAIDPVLARRGFGQSQLVTYWEEIVGGRLGAMSQPLKLQWPSRLGSLDEVRSEAATLVLRVESGFALELQHCTSLVIERVNAHFGWRCVSRLALKQGPVRRARMPARPKLDPAAIEAAAQLVQPIADESLRLALTRLGAHVLRGTQSGTKSASCSNVAGEVTENHSTFRPHPLASNRDQLTRPGLQNG